MNSSYLYVSHTVTLARLLATYVPFLARKKKISKRMQAPGEREKNLAS